MNTIHRPNQYITVSLNLLSAAARLVYHLRARDHITDALICLQWLRAPERILYKMAVLKALHGGSPRYLNSCQEIKRTADCGRWRM